jgi:ABC-2 type transport system ATP-binding protein
MIKIKSLTKKFKNHCILDAVDLNIAAGDKIALVGQNGAGKTTLIRIILGLYQYKGEVSVMGLDPKKNRVEILNQIGFVPQLPPPIQISVEELINYASAVTDQLEPKEIYHKAEELGLDLKAFQKRSFQKLSGGMKQKFLIALALAKKPKILIMDEPAANLDPQGRQAFFLLLTKAMQDCTMLLSSHRVDEVLNLINRIVELDYGKIVQDDDINETQLADKMLDCQIQLLAPNENAMKLLKDWRFDSVNNGTQFSGRFIGADRLKFFTSISHIANYIEKLNIN